MSQINEQVIRGVVEEVLSLVKSGWGGRVAPKVGGGASATVTPPAAASAKANRFGQFTNVDEAVTAAKTAQEQLRPPQPGPAADRLRPHQANLHRPGRRTGPPGVRGNRPRPPAAQAREARHGRADRHRRRGAADRLLQRRPRHHAGGARALGRHRRGHARDPLAADAGRQRHQHDRRRQLAWSATRTPAARRSPPSGPSCSTRPSTRSSASTTSSASSPSRRWRRPSEIFQHPDVRAAGHHRRPRRGGGGAEERQAGHLRRAGQPAGGGGRLGRPRQRRPLHHRGRQLRQQPAVPQREGGLRRGRRSSTA